jgi:hypothetical protein
MLLLFQSLSNPMSLGLGSRILQNLLRVDPRIEIGVYILEERSQKVGFELIMFWPTNWSLTKQSFIIINC